MPTGSKLWLVALAAVAVRLIYLLWYLQSPLAGYHIVDQAYYLDWARRIAAGDWLGAEVFEQGPLYPYLLGVTFRLIGEQTTLIVIAQLAVGVGTALLTCLSARRLFGEPAGFIAGLLAALYGPFVFYECMIMKSFLEPALTAAAFYAIVRFRDDLKMRWLWVCGISIGAACLLRESHVLLVLPAACAAAFPTAVAATTWPRGKRLVSAGILAFAALIALLPSAIRNYRVAGEWVWVTTGGGEVFYMAHGPSATGYYSPPEFIHARPPREHEDFRREAERRVGHALSRGESSRFWFGEGLRHMAADPLRTARLTLVKTSALLNDFEVPDSESFEIARQFIGLLWVLPTFGWLSGLGVLGVVLCLRDWRRSWLPVGFVLAYALPVLLLYNFGRFRIGMLPVWIVLAAHAVDWLLRQWRSNVPKTRSRVTGSLALVGIVTIVSFLPPLGRQQMDYRLGSLLLEGSLARRTGDTARAEQTFQQALQLAQEAYQATGSRRGSQNPAARKLAEAHLELASLYRSDGRTQDALKHFTAAVEVQPDSLEAHFNLANLLMATGQTSAAIEHYQQALAINPRDVDTLVNLGAAMIAEGKLADAATKLGAALAINPGHAQAHYNLANALLMQGQLEPAVEHYRQSLAIDGGNPDVHNNLGQAYLRQNHFPEAMAEFRQALSLDARHANARLNLARAWEAQGNRAEAAAEYRRALALFPANSPQAQAIVERLRNLETPQR